MGNTVAKNAANATAKAAATITDKTLQICTQGSRQDVSFNCETNGVSCPPPMVDTSCNFSNITISQLASIDSNCVQNASTSTTVQQQVAQAVEQTAAAINAGLGISGADASNIVNAAENVSTQVSSTFQQTLAASGNQSVGFYGSNCDNNFTYINIDQAQNFAQNGIQTTSAVTTATQALSQQISQKATAVNLGLVAVLIAVAVVIIAVGYFFKNAAGGAVKILIPIGIIVGAYLGIAFWQKIWPWKNKPFNPNGQCQNVGSGAECPAGQTCVAAGTGIPNYCVNQCLTNAACAGVCSGGACVPCDDSNQATACGELNGSPLTCSNGTCVTACGVGLQPCPSQSICTLQSTGSYACIPNTNACQTDQNCAAGCTCTSNLCVCPQGAATRPVVDFRQQLNPEIMNRTFASGPRYRRN